ncbi:MAG: extradiol dioxygenase family protein [Planctomycetota bacterium]|jgi:extradiol dioxygenase family protein
MSPPDTRFSAPPFHLAFAVDELSSTRQFYGDCLGCSEGRSSASWVDFDFFGHQITAHVVGGATIQAPTNPVDGDRVPIPHFGVVLPWKQWEALAERLREHAIPFLIGPRIRFQGGAGEQGTFFIRDPSGNHLEFKFFHDLNGMFAEESDQPSDGTNSPLESLN